ncbi:hypothetical protein ACFQX4_28240 [Roseomonas sp. GCM10028921]
MDNEAKPYPLAEAAELIGVSVNALRKRVVLRKVPATRSNEDGRWRVWLTPSEIQEAETGRLSRQVAESQAYKVLRGETAKLRSALNRERQRANRAETELAQARTLANQQANEFAKMLVRAVRAEGEAAALHIQGQTELERAVQLERERDAAQADLAEMRQLLEQAARAAVGLQAVVKGAEAGQHDAESRAAASEDEREAAIRRAEEAELRAEDARRRAEEAERRATVATSRLDRIQLARMDEAQAAALASRHAQEAAPSSIWRRLFGRK